ncbi:MAG: hypothetical protein NUW37_06220 [Planctomycetes bacterium]|nr:hypothetical protein [Planctomycetota bacterium]
MDEAIKKRLEILRFRIEEGSRIEDRGSRASEISTLPLSGEGRGEGIKGKLLKIKFGHNPNSSGIGTSSLIFLWSVSIAAVVFNVVTAWVASKKSRE